MVITYYLLFYYYIKSKDVILIKVNIITRIIFNVYCFKHVNEYVCLSSWSHYKITADDLYSLLYTHTHTHTHTHTRYSQTDKIYKLYYIFHSYNNNNLNDKIN